MEQNIVTVGSDAGMPNQQVHNLAIDKHGRIWMAGPSGLCCYNGNSIRVYDTRDGLKCSGLRTLAIQNETTIWLGTDQGIELITLEGQIIDLKFDFDWTFGIAECFLFDDETIWAGTSNGLIKLERNGNNLSLIESLDIGLIKNLALIDEAVLVVSASHGLTVCEGNTISRFCDELPESAIPSCVVRTIDEQYLIGTSEGLFVTNKSGKITDQYKPTKKSVKVTAISIWKDKWVIGFTDQIKVVKQDSFNIDPLETISIRGSINDHTVDNYGNIWVGTNNAGLKKVSVFRSAIKNIDIGKNEAVFTTRYYPEIQNFHIGGEGFYSILQAGNRDNVPILVDFFKLDTIVWDTMMDPVDNKIVWLATQDGLWFKKGESSPTRNDELSSQLGGPTRVLLSRDKTVYLGTISGLYAITNGVLNEVKKSDGSSFRYVYSLSLSDTNKIWVATLGQGLWIENENGFENFTNEHFTASGNTYTIQFNSHGEAVVLQQENILLLNRNLESEIVASEFPMSGWSCTWIDDHRIAVGTDSGLNIVDVRKKYIEKKINLYLERSDWQATSSRSLIHVGDSKLYYGQISGLYYIDFRAIEKIESQPEVLLDAVAWNNTEPIHIADGYKVITGKWTIDASVYCTWYLDERQVKFKFKLAGFDENWSLLSKKSSISFTSLPVGKYELFVQAYSPFTGFAEVTSLFKIEVIRSVKSISQSVLNYLGTFFYTSDFYRMKNKLLLQHSELIKNEKEARKRLTEEFEKYKLDINKLIEQRTQELRYEKERAESLDKQKSIFLASMSHEIRTPLSGISGLAELMKDTDLKPVQREFLKKIETSSNHLLEIINNILDISKIEAGHLEMDNKPFSIFNLVKEVVDFAHIKNQHQNLDIILDEDISLNHLILGDALRLKQVLLNLISNAIKFTEKGFIIVRIKQLETESDMVTLKFSVVDTGIGIKKSDLAVLFREFKQVGVASDNAQSGTGLGLSISYSFIEKMGGILRVNSELNEGSTFSFTLNFEQSSEMDSHAFVAEMSKTSLQKSILLVKCSEVDVQLLTRDLHRIGFSDLKAASTFDDAVSILHEDSFDLGIINLSNYHSSILNDFSKFRANIKNKMSWIAITTSNRPDVASQSYEHGIDQIILKPFTKIDFQRVIHSTFNKALPKKDIKILNEVPSETSKKENKLKNILVAEDDSINQMVIKRVLEREGYTVFITSDGEECVDVFESGPNFDLILMDVQMPKLNGLEATKIIRNKEKGVQTPILAFTADVTPQMQERIHEFGLNGTISKPIDFKQLRETLTKWIR